MAREADLGRPPAVRAPGEVQQARRGGIFGFLGESVAELKKVEWPGQNQVVQGTVVVIVACVIIGSFLYLCDQVFSKLVSKALLGQ